MPVWHSSVAFQPPKPVAAWTPNQITSGVELASGLLAGVGKSLRLFRTPGGSAIHGQKPLTDVEILMLPPGWMEIKAIDELGPTINISPFDPVSSVLGVEQRR